MVHPANHRISSRFAFLAQCGAGVVSLAGCVFLAGWLFDIEFLKKTPAGMTRIKANAAIAFILSGISLWLSTQEEEPRGYRLLAARLPAVFVTLLGLLTFSEHLFGWDIGIDQLFVKATGETAGPFPPGQMVPHAALNFTLVGIALLFLTSSRGHWVISFLGMTSAAISVLAIMGYAYASELLVTVPTYRLMATPTALMFLLLSIAVLLSLRDRGLAAVLASDGAGGTAARRLLPAIILIPILMGWLRFQGYRAGLFTDEYGIALMVMATMLVLLILLWWNADAMDRIDAGRRQAEKALRESMDLLEKVFSNVHISLVYLDRDFNFLRVNKTYADSCGYPPGFFPGKNYFRLYPHKENEAIFRKVVETGELFHAYARPFEFPDHPERGVTYWDWSLLPLKEPGGKVNNLIFCLIDVTERRKAEMELQALNRTLGEVSDTLRGVIQASPLPILLLDPEGNVKIWNPAAELVFGWSRNEVLGRFLPIVTEERKEEFLAMLVRSRQGESFSNLEAQRVRRDGTRLDVLVSTAPLRNVEGNYVGNIAILVDITDRKRIENALRESEERVRSLVEHSPVGIFIVRNGRVVFRNPEQARLFGPMPENFEFRAFRDVHPEDAAKFGELVESISSGGEPAREIDLRFFPYGKSSEGVDMRWVHAITSPMEYGGGKAVLVSMADITRLKEMEHQFLVREKLATLGHVAAGMAHEIRNPLSGINIHLSALEKLHEDAETLDAEGQEHAAEIVRQISSASERIESVIKKMMDFVRPSAMRAGLADINLAIGDAIDFTAVTIRKRGVTLDRSRLESLPKCKADSSLIMQVMMNLITNAAQAMEKTQGPKVIGVSSAVRDGRIVISVSDSGPGVPPALRDRIFDPFFTTRKDGYGIGLSFCRRVIEDHNGVLAVGASRWGGAEFRIELPFEPEQEAGSA